MRTLNDHRFEEGSFDETIRALVRNSPWWLTSAVIHAVAIVVLLQVPMRLVRTSHAQVMRVDETPQLVEPEKEDLDPEQLEPDVRPETIQEVLLDVDVTDEVPQDDVDQPFEETSGPEGAGDGPLEGPWKNSSIGLGGGPGGGPGGRGGRKHLRLRIGSGLTDTAVELGLKWLADHQDVNEDGKWDCDDYMKHDPADDRCDGSGGALFDTGVTGLALLAFLGAGYDDRGMKLENPFRRNVAMGLRYLIQSQSEDGVFGTRATHSYMYNHAIATLAVCEAWWMTRNPRYKRPAQEGLNYLAMARNPYMAWRYEPRGGDNDTSVTGWAVMALKSGKYGGLEVDPAAFEGARLWIDRMTDVNFGQVGYNMPGGVSARPEGRQDRFPPEKTQAMTAAGILTRIFLGEDPRKSDLIRKGARLCAETAPAWNPADGSIDMYYWYYGSLALFQVGGTEWRTWNEAMKKAIVDSQHGKGSGSRTGSWDPIGAWGNDGGRVYSTALMVMCLEVYYRYPRLFGAGDR